MRVVHVITRMIVGGAQETVLLAAALADPDRVEPIVVTGPQTGPEGSLHEEAARRGVRVLVTPSLVREVAPATDLRAVPDLVRMLRTLRPDVVHTHSSKAGIVGRVAARRAGVPGVVHTVHGWPFHDHQPASVRWTWRELERRTAALADRLVVVAETDRSKGLSAGIGTPEQYVTVRSGLELEGYGRGRDCAVRSELGIPANAVVVGAVNRLSPQKDPVSLVRSFAEVARHRPDAWLLIAGDGPLRPAVEAAAVASGVRERVVMAGLRDDVPRLLPAMDVFLSTSRWEGLPRTVLAAMASGVPVVSTPTDGVLDVVQDGVTGLLAPAGDPRALGRAVLRLLDDGVLREAVVAAASARMSEFSATTMARRLEALYAEIR